MVNITNGIGWDQLMDGKMVGAVYTMFDTAMGSFGLIIIFLFIVYQIMLFQKTGNYALMFIMGVIFATMYGLSVYVNEIALPILLTILIFELGGLLYLWLHPKK